MKYTKVMLLALPALLSQPAVALAVAPPEGSPDWIITQDDKEQIESAYNKGLGHCCGYADGRPLNDNGVRFNAQKQHYEVRYNKKRWDAGTVSQTPSEPEPGDVWLEVQPGMLTFDYQPWRFTEAWVSRYADWDGSHMIDHQDMLCLSVRAGY